MIRPEWPKNLYKMRSGVLTTFSTKCYFNTRLRSLQNALRNNSLQNAFSTSLQNASKRIPHLYKMTSHSLQNDVDWMTNLYNMCFLSLYWVLILFIFSTKCTCSNQRLSLQSASSRKYVSTKWWALPTSKNVKRNSLQNAGPGLYEMIGCEGRRVFSTKWPADLGS